MYKFIEFLLATTLLFNSIYSEMLRDNKSIDCSHEDEHRALRPSQLINVVGANGCDNGAIIQAIQSLECNLVEALSCNATCTAIDDLIITVSNDFISTWTILEEIITTITECCNGTFTVLVDINNTLTACCSAIETLTTNCAHTPICEALTITTSGAYCLCQDIEGVIIIAANDVDLDLNSYRISGGANGIIINPGQQRVNVHDGNIGNTIDQAIIVGDGARFITLDTIEITDVATAAFPFAIDFQGSTTGRIADCLIQNVTIGRAQSGILLNNTDFTKIDNCRISECSSATHDVFGISIIGTFIDNFQGNEITNSSISNCSSSLFNAGGIRVQGVLNTVLSNNHVSNILSNLTSFGIQADASLATAIKDCIASEIISTSTAFPCIGIWVSNGSTTALENCRALSIGIITALSPAATIPTVIGCFIESSPRTILENIEVIEVGPSLACVGIWVDEASHTTILRNSSCCNIGYVVPGTSLVGIGFNLLAPNLICEDCSVDGVTGDSAIGYDGGGNSSPTSTTNIIFVRCYATNINGATDARGFRINSSTGYLGMCGVEHIIVPPAEAGTISRGYDVLITSTEILLDSCSANDIRNPNAGEGFNIEGSSTQVQDCTAAHTLTGIIVPTVSATNSTIDHCRATYCTTGMLITAASATVITNCYAANNVANYSVTVPYQAAVGLPYTDPSVVTGFNLSA